MFAEERRISDMAKDPLPIIPVYDRPLVPWDMYTVTVCLLSGYILLPLFVSNLFLLLHPFLPPVAQLIVQQGMTLATWLLIFLVLRVRYGSLRTYLGLRLHHPPVWYLWQAIQLLLLTTALTIVVNQCWQWLFQAFPQGQVSQADPYHQYAMPELLTLSAFAVLVAPLLEEVIFRGFVQTSFYRQVSPFRAVWMTCLVFLLFHGGYFENLRALTHVLVLGLCFGIWRERTQSILPSMVVHLFNNLLASTMLLFRHG